MGALHGDVPASARDGLVLAPFRGLRYDPAVVGDLGRVLSPPYDVLDPQRVRALESANPYNVVRLIVPRGDGPDTDAPTQRYAAVAERLVSWRTAGALRLDDSPALYMYEYTENGVTVRGLVGALGLRPAAAGVVLPHEDVMPGPVADRLALMDTTRSNLEPILCVYEGAADGSPIDREPAEPPLVRATTGDGGEHRLWAVRDPRWLSRIAADLRPRQAMIADGHHRYATYLALQGRHGSAGAVPGQATVDPADQTYDYGLAMLVDQNHWPLRLGAIHRSVSGLGWQHLMRAPVGRVDEMPSRQQALQALTEASAGSCLYVATDGRRFVTLDVRGSAAATRVPVAWLHQTLDRLGVGRDRIGYHHDAESAVDRARSTQGLAFLVRPPTMSTVLEAARAGRRLPQKATSFGPKPQMGVVMRLLSG